MPVPCLLRHRGLPFLGAALALALAAFPPASAAPGRSRLSVPSRAVAPTRIEALSRKYLGTPYKLDCLGEGKGPDSDPLFTRKYVDCQTLVEQVMAEALAEWTGGQDRAVRLIRYHHEDVRLENRYHYCLPDWLENPWPVADITAKVGGKPVESIRRRIDRPRFLASRGGDPGASPMPAETVRTEYIPRARIPAIEANIPDGSIGVWVLTRPDIVAGHLGFLFRKDGHVIFRHASQTRKQVVDEPLLAYLARAPSKFMGMKILQPDVSGLQR
jgi:hypothetical protein